MVAIRWLLHAVNVKNTDNKPQQQFSEHRTGPADAEAKRINTAERTRTTRIHGGQTSRDEERLDSRSFETTNILVSKHRGDQNEWQQPWCRRQHHGHLFVDRKVEMVSEQGRRGLGVPCSKS
jgi:hypothetical protein